MFGPKIHALREKGFSYRQIVKALGCSKATVAYHCSKSEREKPLPHRSLSSIPKDSQPMLTWLLEAGVRKVDISDALDLPYRQVLRFSNSCETSVDRSTLTNYEKVKLRRRHLKMLAVAFKGGACTRCGYDRSLRAFCFHHPEPLEKEFTVSQITNRSWKTVKQEVAKCVLLCANCHMEEHDEYL